MAHALGLAAHLIEGRFIVSACDSLVNVPLIRDLPDRRGRAETVLSLLDVEPERVSRSAAVELDGDEVRRNVEKPTIGGERPSCTVSPPHFLFPLPNWFCRSLATLSRSARGGVRSNLPGNEAIQRHIDDGARVVGVRTAERDCRFPRPVISFSLSRKILRDEFRTGQAAQLASRWIGHGVGSRGKWNPGRWSVLAARSVPRYFSSPGASSGIVLSSDARSCFAAAASDPVRWSSIRLWLTDTSRSPVE